KIDVRPAAILDLLRNAARSTLSSLIRHELEDASSKLLVRAISCNTDRSKNFSAADLRASLIDSRRRIDEILEGKLSAEELSKRENSIREALNNDLEGSKWIATFRGRDVLKGFLALNLNNIVRYEVFRDLIVAKMR